MSKIVDKSVKLAFDLFPDAYSKRKKHQPFHFAFLFKKNRLVSIGQNNTTKESAKALYFAQRYNLKQQKKYPFIHAEIDAVSKAFGKIYVDNSFSIVSLRVSQGFILKNANPCKACSSVMKALNIDCVYYSDARGKIVKEEL
tara:strand:+ start:74 stop:499 length:426 start_codon:yes stop_codon:yes gene_type:complete